MKLISLIVGGLFVYTTNAAMPTLPTFWYEKDSSGNTAVMGYKLEGTEISSIKQFVKEGDVNDNTCGVGEDSICSSDWTQYSANKRNSKFVICMVAPSDRTAYSAGLQTLLPMGKCVPRDGVGEGISSAAPGGFGVAYFEKHFETPDAVPAATAGTCPSLWDEGTDTWKDYGPCEGAYPAACARKAAEGDTFLVDCSLDTPSPTPPPTHRPTGVPSAAPTAAPTSLPTSAPTLGAGCTKEALLAACERKEGGDGKYVLKTLCTGDCIAAAAILAGDGDCDCSRTAGVGDSNVDISTGAFCDVE